MSKNKVQFQMGYSLLDLFKNYGTGRQCAEALLCGAGPVVSVVLTAVPVVIVSSKQESSISVRIATIKPR